MGEGSQKVQTSNYRISPGGMAYSVMAAANGTTFHI